MTVALQVMTAAARSLLRLHLLAGGQPDRFLSVAAAPAPRSEARALRASTRGLPAVLLTEHPSWLWSGGTLESAGFDVPSRQPRHVTLISTDDDLPC